ncbi:hypothetical protein NA57DRAFT_34905 [Rhizodiscina lignyota]|uniref:Fe2OG dioxygenase domain-containing protein n=1 Tax=Rhizodiscina lignyota TaxID=1504668 RepID=A0A9P4M838_9PEZI|nr:hypothetical protein NA57DRAFT_34905 [Rhizodiscina lignyota]
MDHADTASNPLNAFRICCLPENFYYVPNFITSEEDASILLKLPPNRWISLSHRRLQVHPSQLSSSNTLLDAPLPAWLTTTPPILQRFEELGVFANTPHGQPNHCLINEYNPGEGIMPHEDGSAYAPVVATVSLGDNIVLDIYDKRKGENDANDDESPGNGLPPIARIFQEPGSLLITTGEAYTSLLHGISPITEDVGLGPDTVANWDSLSEATRNKIVDAGGKSVRGTRTSLTYRDVLKVRKVGIGIVGKR